MKAKRQRAASSKAIRTSSVGRSLDGIYRVGTSSSSSRVSKVGAAGELRKERNPLEFVTEPTRQPLTEKVVRELEDAGLVETAQVAEKLTS